MLLKSRERRDAKIKWADNLEEILEAVETKNFVKAPWCGDRACEDAIKEFSQASARIISEDCADNIPLTVFLV